MIKIPFLKMHGLGNDFVIMNKQDIQDNIDIKKLAILASCRKLGIGCDQFIIYQHDDTNIVKMYIRNPDGSTAKACGNASRCLARIIFDITGNRNITLDVDSRMIPCHYINEEKIEVNMGQVRLNPAWAPRSEFTLNFAKRYNLAPKEIIYVDIGNPHIVLFGEFSDSDKEIIGHFLQNTDEIKDGINVNFASVKNDVINLSVWERYTGITLACGSGASATFAAASKLGFVKNGAAVLFAHGKLEMSLKDDEVVMCGPASYVYNGEYIYDSSR